MDSVSSPVSPEAGKAPYQLASIPPKRPWLKWVIAVAIVIIVLAGAAALYAYTSVGTYVQMHLFPVNIPSELQGAQFLGDGTNGGTVSYHAASKGLVGEASPDMLVSATQDGTGSARITRTAAGMFVVTLDGTDILNDMRPRIDIARAPKGDRVAFAQGNGDPGTFVSPAVAPTTPLEVKAWNVEVYDPAAHTTADLGPGASPMFVDETHVAWISPAGLSMADLTSGTSVVLIPDATKLVPLMPLISPDNSIMGWYEGSPSAIALYKVTTSGATSLPATAIKTPARSVTVGNDALYVLSNSMFGVQITKQAFGQAEAEAVVTIPSAYAIRRMQLGTI